MTGPERRPANAPAPVVCAEDLPAAETLVEGSPATRRSGAGLRLRGATRACLADQAGHRKRQGSRGGRPVSYDVQDLKQRNVVERFFNRMKNWRGLASRFDKHALVYRGGVVLAAILDWLR